MDESDELWGVFRMCRDGSVQAEGAAGASDQTTGEPCTMDTLFQAASISKQFVAASVMLLDEHGTMSLEDAVPGWWRRAPHSWDSMTVGHLLAHSSGLGHWADVPGLDILRPPSPGEILDRATKQPLRSRPGARWAYSGVGYLLAAAIIEAASGQTYGRFVADHVFRPLRMSSTTSGVMPRGRRVAKGRRHGVQTPPVSGLTALPGTGDVWTTVGDLIRYAEAIRSGELLSDRSLRLMTMPHITIDEPATSKGGIAKAACGFGIFIGTIAGGSAWFHPGDNPGFRTLLAWLPGTDTTLAVLCNEEFVALDDIVPRLLQASDR